MYEARQNKERVSRTIEVVGIARQRVKMGEFGKRISSVPIQRLFDQAIQREPKYATIHRQDNSQYDIEYFDTVSNFCNGSPAGNIGITGVTNYYATASIGGKKDFSGLISAYTHVYHRGHMLAAGLGGSGNNYNIFQQDGGQNTAGAWPSFERNVTIERDRVNKVNKNAPMSYRICLNGFLNYNQRL